jgi:hypothetical protein
METKEMEVDYDTLYGDLSPSRQPHYFYRLSNTDEQHRFQQSDQGIKCPICAKELKNVRMHLNNNKNCSDQIDMDHFMHMYKILNNSVRKGYLRSKKQNRENQRERWMKGHTKEQGQMKNKSKERRIERWMKRVIQGVW